MFSADAEWTVSRRKPKNGPDPDQTEPLPARGRFCDRPREPVHSVRMEPCHARPIANPADPRRKALNVTLTNLLRRRWSSAKEPSAERHAPRRPGGRWMQWGSLALALATGLILVRSTSAETTPESLIGGAVSDKGPYYQDLSQAIVRFREGNIDAARAFLAAARNKAPNCRPSR